MTNFSRLVSTVMDDVFQIIALTFHEPNGARDRGFHFDGFYFTPTLESAVSFDREFEEIIHFVLPLPYKDDAAAAFMSDGKTGPIMGNPLFDSASVTSS